MTYRVQEEVVYAELTLARHRSAHLGLPMNRTPGAANEVADGVVYAQIDHTKRKTKPAPPPPTASQSMSHVQHHPTLAAHTSIRLPDVSQTLTIGGSVRETTLM